MIELTPETIKALDKLQKSGMKITGGLQKDEAIKAIATLQDNQAKETK